MIISALYAGQPAPLGPRNALSAIAKKPINQLTVHFDKTKEDLQANKRLHGGPEKVLHQYSLQGYNVIHQHFPELSSLAIQGSIGENITVADMHDENVFIGDTYAFGDVIVQVSAPRAPCNKINHKFGVNNIDRFVGNHGITGWYYRVKEVGTIELNDTVKLLHRPAQSVSVGALMRAVYNPEHFAQAEQYIHLQELDTEWREKCYKAMAKVSPQA